MFQEHKHAVYPELGPGPTLSAAEQATGDPGGEGPHDSQGPGLASQAGSALEMEKNQGGYGHWPALAFWPLMWLAPGGLCGPEVSCPGDRTLPPVSWADDERRPLGWKAVAGPRKEG